MDDFLLLFSVFLQQVLIILDYQGLSQPFLIFEDEPTQHYQVLEAVHPDLQVPGTLSLL